METNLMKTNGERKLCPMLMAANLTHKDARGDESLELSCRQESCAWWPMCSAAAVWSRAAFVDPEGRIGIDVKAGKEKRRENTVVELVAWGDGMRRRFTGGLLYVAVPATVTFRSGSQVIRDDGFGSLVGDTRIGAASNAIGSTSFDFAFACAPANRARISVTYQTTEGLANGVAKRGEQRGEETPNGMIDIQDYLNLEEEFEDLKKQANKLELELYVARSVKADLAGHLDIPEDTPFQEIQRLVVEDMGRTDVYEQGLQRLANLVIENLAGSKWHTSTGSECCDLLEKVIQEARETLEEASDAAL